MCIFLLHSGSETPNVLRVASRSDRSGERNEVSKRYLYEMKRPCKWPLCPNLIDRTARYCPLHQPRADAALAERHAQYDQQQRSPEAVSFYRSKQWQTLRRDVLDDQPICAICRRQFASDVDHIQPRTARPDLQWDRDNLQGLCAACHSIKSGRERRKCRPLPIHRRRISHNSLAVWRSEPGSPVYSFRLLESLDT